MLSSWRWSLNHWLCLHHVRSALACSRPTVDGLTERPAHENRHHPLAVVSGAPHIVYRIGGRRIGIAHAPQEILVWLLAQRLPLDLGKPKRPARDPANRHPHVGEPTFLVEPHHHGCAYARAVL